MSQAEDIDVKKSSKDGKRKEQVKWRRGSQSKLAKKEEKQARKQARSEAKNAGMSDRRTQRGVVRERFTLDRGAAIQRLEGLVAALKSGTVSFEQSDRHIMLEVAEAVDLRVRGSRKAKTESLTIRMRWKSAVPPDAEIPESATSEESSEGTPSAQE